MKKFTSVLFALFLFACKKHNNTTSTSGSWTKTSTFAGAVPTFDPIGFAIDSNLYIGMGSPQPGGVRSTGSYVYNESSNAWGLIPNFSFQGGGSGVGFAIGGTGYVVLNPTTTTAGELYSYDTATGSWARMADFPGEMSTATSAFSLNGKGYVGFGTSSTATNTFYRYDPASNIWSNVSDFPGTQYAGTTCFVIGNYAYAGTGAEIVQGGNLSYAAQFYRYDAASDSWSPIANFPGTPRMFATGFSVGNMGYIVGGSDSSGKYLNDVWQYDPGADKWTQQADFPGGARGVALGFSGGTAAYYGFGHDSQTGYYDFWEFKP